MVAGFDREGGDRKTAEIHAIAVFPARLLAKIRGYLRAEQGPISLAMKTSIFDSLVIPLSSDFDNPVDRRLCVLIFR